MSALLDSLQFVGDALDRPGAAVRGLLAGRPSQLAYLMPGAESMGLVDPRERVGGRDLLRQYGMAGEEDNWSNFLGGMAVDTVTNPLNWPGIGIAAKYGAKALGDGASALMKRLSPTRFSDMKALRDAYPVAYNVPISGNGGETFRIVGGGGNNAYDKVVDLMIDLGSYDNAGTKGMYDIGKNAAALLEDSHPTTWRHEVLHGNLANAVEAASPKGLPAAQLPAYYLNRASLSVPEGGMSDFLRGMGVMSDEAAAHALQNRGFLNQLKGGAEYLFRKPFQRSRMHDIYAANLGDISPAAEQVYRIINNTPRNAIIGGGVLGGGYAGYKGLSALSSQLPME